MIDAVIERCVGIDVGKKFLVACVMTGPARGEARSEIRQFGTVGSELKKLREWIQQEGCTHAIMESTGSYWKPIFNVLEDVVRWPWRIRMRSRRGRDTRQIPKMPGGWRICCATPWSRPVLSRRGGRENCGI